MERKDSIDDTDHLERGIIVQEDQKDYFCTDVTELTEEEQKACIKFETMRDDLMKDGQMHFLDGYHDSMEVISNSKLYQTLKNMPKGGHLHLHLTAAAGVDFLIELTKDDVVYYNMKKNKLMVFPNGEPDEGYTQCNMVRSNWSSEGTFESYLKNKILLTAEDIKSKHSSTIWGIFQYKFDLTFELYNYYRFFEKILAHVLTYSMDEKWFIVELRHIFGCVFDDKKIDLNFTDEMAIFGRWLDTAHEREPIFELKIISCGLKIFGDAQIKSQLTYCIAGLKKTKLIAGFDLVWEEDITPPLKSYRRLIRTAQEKQDKGDPPLNVFLHAGESCSRFNENLYDALMIGTKRIGHGFAILNHPYLTDQVKEKDICLEVCPVSNLILGYWFDLRWHPARALMHRGIPLSISGDDPGFYGTTGVTLDYAYATLAWQLSVKELKQFALNGIKYAAITEESKEKVSFIFVSTSWYIQLCIFWTQYFIASWKNAISLGRMDQGIKRKLNTESKWTGSYKTSQIVTKQPLRFVTYIQQN
jgi:adenosine deaminase CECR1